jgi:dihydrofolate reductase
MPTYKLIVAVCNNNGIGMNRKIPWSIKTDMNYFTKMTKKTIDQDKKNAVIMGRNTWESLPPSFSPLSERDNLILSSTLQIDSIFNNSIIKTFPKITDVINFCNSNASRYETIWIIGGTTIYKQFLELKIVSECYITYIKKDYTCDTFFDLLYNNDWNIIKKEIFMTNNNIELEFQVLKFLDPIFII